MYERGSVKCVVKLCFSLQPALESRKGYYYLFLVDILGPQHSDLVFLYTEIITV